MDDFKLVATGGEVGYSGFVAKITNRHDASPFRLRGGDRAHRQLTAILFGGSCQLVARIGGGKGCIDGNLTFTASRADDWLF